MASGITSRELVELAAFESVDPPLGYRIDYGFAALQSMLYNIHRGKGRVRRVHEFMPEWGPPDPKRLEGKLRMAFSMIEKKDG